MAFHGRQARNAGKDLRITKRQEAEERNARYQLALKMATPEENLLTEIFGEGDEK
jgi:hypothetical protein